jgi:hypothetical protein
MIDFRNIPCLQGLPPTQMNPNPLSINPMTRRTRLTIGIAALAIVGAVAARSIFPPPAVGTPIKASPRASAKPFDHSHKAFDVLLKDKVKDGQVNYAALKSSPGELTAYLGQLASIKESTFKTWDENQQQAMLINLYNAATLKLIIDHYPVKSIKDIGGLFKKPWDIKSLTLFGKTITLNHLEHKILRKNYDEPRVHFAIVCAAKGCPILRTGAYTADRLDTQLKEQGEAFLRDPKKNRVDAAKKVVYLSKIFNWFESDFEKGGSVIGFVKPYFAPADAKSLGKNFKIKYTSYDWSLNKQ